MFRSIFKIYTTYNLEDQALLNLASNHTHTTPHFQLSSCAVCCVACFVAVWFFKFSLFTKSPSLLSIQVRTQSRLPSPRLFLLASRLLLGPHRGPWRQDRFRHRIGPVCMIGLSSTGLAVTAYFQTHYNPRSLLFFNQKRKICKFCL